MERDKVEQALGTSYDTGLSASEARARLAEYGKNLPVEKASSNPVMLLLSQFKSPLTLILIASATVSYFLESPQDATIILVIVFLSAGLGFWQERGATRAVSALLQMVRTTTTVVRDFGEHKISAEEVVPGDIVSLAAGDRVPCDCYIAESKDLFVNESVLTGESFPVEKDAAGKALPAETPVQKRSNSLFAGSHVSAGRVRAVAVNTGANTEFGHLSSLVKSRRAPTGFERGVRRFGYFLLEVTLILVIANFSINVFLARPVLDSFLFSLAIAIGVTPQLLPAIISVNLAHGARKLASRKVIVRKLDSIENLGSMNILCSDKTGTLTTGVISLHSAVNAAGEPDAKVLLYAYLNSANETGFANPIDQAIVRAAKGSHLGISDYEKLDEIPYDFARKRLSILVRRRQSAGAGETLLVTKGAVASILAICTRIEMAGSVFDIDPAKKAEVLSLFERASKDGFRVLAVCYRAVGAGVSSVAKDSEEKSTFLGFLVLEDPVRADAQKSIAALDHLGVTLKMISGDNALIARYVGAKVGLSDPQVLTGPELDGMTPEVLERRAAGTDVFAEIEPRQKERIILALKKSGNVVGYMGDGVNDAPALHASDVGISVNNATDVVKEEADIVLLEKNLGVLADGIREGRRTFANTMKYIFIATSSNFGNMFSTAVASFFLSFLPMLPKQILLNNLLTDIQETSIATDSVDRGALLRPRRWEMETIQRFMIVFGAVSAVFDFVMFGSLSLVLHATTEQFRTAWFIESVLSASLVVLVVRSRKALIRSRPSKYLVIATCAVSAFALVTPLTPVSAVFGFVSLPAAYYALIAAVVGSYVAAAELAKAAFYRKRR